MIEFSMIMLLFHIFESSQSSFVDWSTFSRCLMRISRTSPYLILIEMLSIVIFNCTNCVLIFFDNIIHLNVPILFIFHIVFILIRSWSCFFFPFLIISLCKLSLNECISAFSLQIILIIIFILIRVKCDMWW